MFETGRSLKIPPPACTTTLPESVSRQEIPSRGSKFPCPGPKLNSLSLSPVRPLCVLIAELMIRHCPEVLRKKGSEQRASFCAAGKAVTKSASPDVKLLDSGKMVASWLFVSCGCLRYSQRKPSSRLARGVRRKLSCANRLNQPPPARWF